jgi:hypothetical protein
MPVRSDRPVPVRQGGSELPGKAIGKYVRVPPRKAREVVELIKGLPVEDAEQVVRFSKRRGAQDGRESPESRGVQRPAIPGERDAPSPRRASRRGRGAHAQTGHAPSPGRPKRYPETDKSHQNRCGGALRMEGFAMASLPKTGATRKGPDGTEG